MKRETIEYTCRYCKNGRGIIIEGAKFVNE